MNNIFNNIFAYIPARGGSKRLPGKNIRELSGKPVLTRVIESLHQAGMEGVAVSTEDYAIAQFAKDAGAETLELRQDKLSADDVQIPELVQGDVPRFAEHYSVSKCLLVLATAGLVTPDIFRAAINRFIDRSPAFLLAVTNYRSSPYFALVENDDGSEWTPLHPEELHMPAHERPQTVVDAGLFYLIDLEKCRGLGSLYDAKPLDVFNVPSLMAVDVNTKEDWMELERRFDQ